MRLFYSRWDDSLFQQLRQMRDLMQIFNDILLQVNGDVKTALKIMNQLKKMGYLPKETDLDEFRRQLEDNKIIADRQERRQPDPQR